MPRLCCRRCCGRRLRGFCAVSVYPNEMVDTHAHGCLEPEVLATYVDHGLSLAERARVETHLASCPTCTALLAGVVRTVAEIAPVLPQAVDAVEVSPRAAWRAIARALAAAAAVIAVLALRSEEHTSELQSRLHLVC